MLQVIKIGLFIFALVAALFFSRWLQRNSNAMPKAFFLMGFLPFVIFIPEQPLQIALILDLTWSGIAQGLVFSLPDVVALTIYLSLPRARNPLPFRFSMLLYFVAVLLSTFQTDLPIEALFYCWQLVRIFLFYVVVARACTDERTRLALMAGMTVGLIIQAGAALYQGIFVGELRAGGTLGSVNIAGMLSYIVVIPSFALLLAGQRGWQLVTAQLAGLALAILSVSRAAIGLFGVGFLVTFALSALQGWTSRKGTIALVGVIIIAVASPFVLQSIEKRYANDLNEIDIRPIMIEVASAILTDHPMGIGANNYVRIANMGGYNFRAGMGFNYYMLNTDVHNVYWLVAAETGYFGICTFVLLLLRLMVSAFICGWKNRRDRRGSLLLGLSVTLLLIYVHSWFEFVLLLQAIQYPFAIIAGLVSSLTMELGYWQPKKLIPSPID